MLNNGPRMPYQFLPPTNLILNQCVPGVSAWWPKYYLKLLWVCRLHIGTPCCPDWIPTPCSRQSTCDFSPFFPLLPKYPDHNGLGTPWELLNKCFGNFLFFVYITNSVVERGGEREKKGVERRDGAAVELPSSNFGELQRELGHKDPWILWKERSVDECGCSSSC